MKTKCPKCRQEFEITKDCLQSISNDTLLVQCGQCGAGGIQVKISIHKTETASTSYNPAERAPAFLVCINKSLKSTTIFPLKWGTNTIGRKSQTVEVDIALPTTDMAMGRKHCSIKIERDKTGVAVASVENISSKNKIFLNWDYLRPVLFQEDIFLKDGAILQLGPNPSEIRDVLVFIENKPGYSGIKDEPAKQKADGETEVLDASKFRR